MSIVNNQNPDLVKYFELRDYIDKIKVDNNVLQHMEDTNKEFNSYMKRINIYDKEEIIHFWLIQMAEELVYSNKIEKHFIKKQDILKQDLFFNTLEINHNRIHELHKFVMQTNDSNIKSEYRDTPIRVSAIYPDGSEKIYWHGPNPNDVKRFMDAFIDVYKTGDVSIINSNPFLKSALIQLLFIRIHPYKDGNGRTSRILHSIKFTESINKIYDKNFKLCPLNISGSILINQFTYVNILDNIYFDLEHDNTEFINRWFDFILNMIDEQLYYSNSRINKLRETYDLYKVDDKKFNIILQKILNDIRDIDSINEVFSAETDIKKYLLK